MPRDLSVFFIVYSMDYKTHAIDEPENEEIFSVQKGKESFKFTV